MTINGLSEIDVEIERNESAQILLQRQVRYLLQIHHLDYWKTNQAHVISQISPLNKVRSYSLPLLDHIRT